MDGNADTKKVKCDLDSLKQLLDENGIQNKLLETTLYNGSLCRYVLFMFPVARQFEEIGVYEDDNIENLISSNFVKYRGISNYEAIWSGEFQCIECEVQNPISNMSNRYLMRNISRFAEADQEQVDHRGIKEPISFPISSDGNIKVSIGYASKVFTILTGYKEGRRIAMDVDRSRYKVTLKVENVAIKTEEEARKLIEKISNTLFYQIDMRYNLTITLSPRRESRAERLRRMRKRDRHDLERRDIKLDYEYDTIPMSLYWFAQNNVDSPIFMYFALYQVLEYYYPIYATGHAKTKIQNLIKDPTFNINKDADVVRLLNIIKANNVGNIGDEREQLGITLRNITSGEDIIQYILDNESLHEYYKGKDSQKLSNQKMRLTDNIGIVEDLAERIYDVRCRIVHNKASETSKKILPMTKDVDYLRHEVEMLKFVARKAIIANSRPFSLS